MEHKIKLREKQLIALTNIANQKAQINKLMADLNQSESLILELLLEEAGITNQVNNIKLDGGFITFEEVPAATKAKAKKAKGETPLKKVE